MPKLPADFKADSGKAKPTVQSDSARNTVSASVLLKRLSCRVAQMRIAARQVQVDKSTAQSASKTSIGATPEKAATSSSKCKPSIGDMVK